MRICFIGDTHLTFCVSVAAARRGFVPVPVEEILSAELIFIAQDMPTNADGKRMLFTIEVNAPRSTPIISMMQTTPGKHRQNNDSRIFHQPETLRILDATDRAYAPECIVVGCANKADPLPEAYQKYLDAFGCPIVKTDYETAEFSKIAINMYLASQVDTTNRLAAAANKVGADWDALRLAIGYDSRIGKYLTPGRWEDSIHLLRDYVTLKEIEEKS